MEGKREPEPELVTEYWPPCGPCVVCGGPDARHRVWDAMLDRHAAGDTLWDLATDYAKPTDAVQVLVEWLSTERES